MEEIKDETIDLGVMFADCVAFQVVGSSMSDEAIESGDYVIIRKDDSPPAGSIVVGMAGGHGRCGQEVRRARLPAFDR